MWGLTRFAVYHYSPADTIYAQLPLLAYGILPFF